MNISRDDSKDGKGRKAGQSCHICSSAAIRAAIEAFTRFMPWKDGLVLYIEENLGKAWLKKPDVPRREEATAKRLSDLPGDAELSLWMVVRNNFYAILAASGLLNCIHPQLRKIDSRISQFVIASNWRPEEILVRPIAWMIGDRDYRNKKIRLTTIEQFAKSLTAPPNLQGERCIWGSDIVVEHVDDDWNERIQNWALDEFLKHAWKNDFLDIHPIHAHDLLRSADLSSREEPTFSRVPTRWKAIRALIDEGHLHPSRRQVSMRPLGSKPSWNDIMRMLQGIGMSDEAALAARCRKVELVYERYLAATILQESTDIPVQHVGRFFNDRRHSSIGNGIKRFRSLSEELPAQDILLNILLEAADNIGVYRSWKLHKRSETYLR